MSDLPPIEISVIPETQEEVDLAVLKVINADKFLVSTNNLSDIEDPEEAKVNLGIVYETTTQLNARDTANRNRTNHTGTQSISTISGLETALQTGKKETVILALTDPSVSIALGEILAINAFPYAMTITSIRADVAVAPTGANLIVDMRQNGVSMMTNKFVIEATEASSATAATLPSLSSSSLAIGDKLSFNVDQIGATVAGQYLTIAIEGERV